MSARLQNGTLKVVDGACPNLLAEAGLYRWDDESGSEAPEDRNNHALAALRYMVSKLDQRSLGKTLKDLIRKVLPEQQNPEPPQQPEQPKPPEPKKRKPWNRYGNEELWTRNWWRWPD